MRKIRVLIVDDSAVVRSIVSRVLLADPLVESCDVAADGEIALLENLLPGIFRGASGETGQTDHHQDRTDRSGFEHRAGFYPTWAFRSTPRLRDRFLPSSSS